jgi:hypothetical protein
VPTRQADQPLQRTRRQSVGTEVADVTAPGQKLT